MATCGMRPFECFSTYTSLLFYAWAKFQPVPCLDSEPERTSEPYSPTEVSTPGSTACTSLTLPNNRNPNDP